MDRFYCPELPTQLGDPIAFPDDEANHASRVLRKVSGDRVEVFDGRGSRAIALLVDVRKKGVSAELASDVIEDPPRAKRLTLATAVPKADRFKWLVEKATELGVDRLVPVTSQRSIVYPGGNKLEKMRSQVVAACKQSGRNHLMELGELTTLEDVFNQNADAKYLADVPTETEARSSVESSGDSGQTLVLIGPEGGWTDEERTAARAAGFQPFVIGTHVLRIETAAIAAAARFAK